MWLYGGMIGNKRERFPDILSKCTAYRSIDCANLARYIDATLPRGPGHDQGLFEGTRCAGQ